MFDTIVNPTSGVPRKRWTTTLVSAVGHVAAIIASVLTAVYATDVLPSRATRWRFSSRRRCLLRRHPRLRRLQPARVKPAVTKTTRPRPAPVIAKAPAAAPVEAPASITPETGLEGGEFAPAAIEPGFETGIPGELVGGVLGGVITALPPPPPKPVAPVRVGGAISTPRLIHRVDPNIRSSP